MPYEMWRKYFIRSPRVWLEIIKIRCWKIVWMFKSKELKVTKNCLEGYHEKNLLE